MFGLFNNKEPVVPILCAMCKLYKPVKTQDMGDEFCFLCIVKRAREALSLDEYNQPIRKKHIEKKDILLCENCHGVPRIFNCCGEKHLNDIQCNEYRFRMRCSTDCIDKPK